MRRALVSTAVAAIIVIVPAGAYVLLRGGHGAELRATVGRCSRAQRPRHRAACAYIDRHPALEIVGPIDETGSPFAQTLQRADARREIAVRLDGGRYAITIEIDRHGTVRANPRTEIDLSTGDDAIGTVTPATPWQRTGVPGG